MSQDDRPRGFSAVPTLPQPGVEVFEALAAPGSALWLLGEAGAGASGMAQVVAERMGHNAVVVRVIGCESAEDLVLALGHAVGAIPAGDEGALANALRARGDALLVVDEADVPGLEEVWQALHALAPRLRWLFTGRRCPLAEGELRRISLPPGPAHPRLRSDPEIALLSRLPAGLPPVGPLPAKVLAVDGPRRALRRGLLGLDLADRAEEDGPLALRLALRFGPLLAVAQGAPFPAGLCWQDLLALRFIAAHSPDDTLACQAAAVAGRLCAAWGQPQVGRALLDAALYRHQGAPAQARCLLFAAQAEGAVLIGDVEEAEGLAQRAVAAAAAAGEASLAATLAARWADRLSSLGAVSRAAAAWREARKYFRAAGEAAGLGVALRGSADLGVVSGELHSAEALYEQAEGVAATPAEQANRQIGLAGLALAQGALDPAGRRLRAAEPLVGGLPLLEANLLRRRAELLLRRGQADSAFLAAFDARARYAGIGELVAAGHTTRLLGDIVADQGEGGAARRWYQEAVDLQLRIRDRVGLRRTLRHLAALEAEAGHHALVDEINRDVDDLAEEA